MEEERLVEMNTAIEDRMVDLAIKAWHGEYEELISLAEASGIPVEHKGETLRFNGDGDGITAGIYPELDPITILVQLGFAFFGAHWPHVIPNAMEKMKKRWKEEMKKPKERKEGSQKRLCEF